MFNPNQVYKKLLETVINYGHFSKPRDMPTSSVYQNTTTWSMTNPVITSVARKLNYRFMAAEAYWILSGDDRVSTIAPYNKHISQFSDDGEKFYGAYGPKIKEQLSYVVETLANDIDSRQAFLTIWRENPRRTKDVPCTITIGFSVVEDELNCHVFMRSSDVFLGIPYDVFNFSMVSYLICCKLKEKGINKVPGALYLTAANQHLYHRDLEKANEVIEDFKHGSYQHDNMNLAPEQLWSNDGYLLEYLRDMRETSRGHEMRWWEK